MCVVLEQPVTQLSIMILSVKSCFKVLKRHVLLNLYAVIHKSVGTENTYKISLIPQ